MGVELEAKVKVSDHEAVRDRLRKAGAECFGSVLETNCLFDDAADSLLKMGCGLRVRTCVGMEGPAPAATLTYKGAIEGGPFKRRTEIEVEIADAEAMTEILRSLGFCEKVIFEKRRESWRLDAARIELDELPTLGRFVEVEARDEETVHDVLVRLGLYATDTIRKSYAALLTQDMETNAAGPWVFKFP